MKPIDNSKKIEQSVKLKDSREIYKTNNGFTAWLKDQKGNVTEVSHEYYKKVFKNRIK